MLQGATFEPFARLLGATSDEQALPAPLLEPGAVRRLGAEVVQYAGRPATPRSATRSATSGCRATRC